MPRIKLSKNFIRSACKLALNEDLFPSGDITSNLLKNDQIKKIKMISNEKGIVGGLEFAKKTFELIDKKIPYDTCKPKDDKSFIRIILNELQKAITIYFLINI